MTKSPKPQLLSRRPRPGLLLALALAPAGAARAAPRGQPLGVPSRSAPDAEAPAAEAPEAGTLGAAPGRAPAPELGVPEESSRPVRMPGPSRRLVQATDSRPPGAPGPAPARPPAPAAEAPAPAAYGAGRKLPPPELRRSVAAAVGGLFPFSVGPTMPRFSLQLSGPWLKEGLGVARVEWLATAAFGYSGRETVSFSGTSQDDTLATELMPGARLLYPVHPRLNVSLEVSAGLSLAHRSATLHTLTGATHHSDLDWGAVGRVAIGGQIPLDDRLRLFIEPVAVQTYVASGEGPAWSMQFGLAYTY
ncbi:MULTISPECIES: hypothetical protein [Myxococcaceae]|uniref:hypothetical protein n=1 Tax=Myxococcaceae TaxID=31 RepID=UPI00129CB9EB|nr:MULTISPECIES: hypothetical protein [Myxococcaceae]MBF5046109.1 hypothetical protein [Simulacricoccus sp. 17bor-14]